MDHVESLLKTTLAEVERLLSTRTVVGEPVNIEGQTIIPLIAVGFGFGAGGGSGKNQKTASLEGLGAGSGAAVGVGVADSPSRSRRLSVRVRRALAVQFWPLMMN